MSFKTINSAGSWEQEFQRPSGGLVLVLNGLSQHARPRFDPNDSERYLLWRILPILDGRTDSHDFGKKSSQPDHHSLD